MTGVCRCNSLTFIYIYGEAYPLQPYERLLVLIKGYGHTYTHTQFGINMVGWVGGYLIIMLRSAVTIGLEY